jgi:hypothetical protein
MDLRTEDIAAALRAAAAVFVRKGAMGEALDAAAETLEKRQAIMTAAGRTLRSEKAPGDVVIGSVCYHDWKPDLETLKISCRQCKEAHEEGCPALHGGKCDCGPPPAQGV